MDSKEASSPFELHRQLLDTVHNSKQSFVVMGQLLHGLKKKGAFREAIGEGIDTWDDYISQPEIGLSRGEADRLIQIYEQFVLRLGVTPEYLSTVPIKNLHYLLPVAKDSPDDEHVNALLGDAKELSQKDFRERVQEVKNPDGPRTYEYLVMKKCKETGAIQKVHNIDSNVIQETFGLHD